MATPPSVLIDVGCLCDDHTNATLEFMAKAIGEEPPGGDIWAEHPNPYVRRLVELFTQRGLDRIAGLQEELTAWVGGENFKLTGDALGRPANAMRRWSPGELALTRLYLTNLPPAEFTLDDWMLLVDYLVQKYLPEADLRTEADWLATRSALMGRVQAQMGVAGEASAEGLAAALPASFEEAAAAWGMTPAQSAAINFGRARAAEHVTAISDSARRQLRNLIVDYQEASFLGNRAEAHGALQTRLLDTFGTMNRDWRRIAVTEATENVNQGMVASHPPGTRLRRLEKYRGACAWCRSIDGKVVTVVAANAVDKDGDNQIWVGKTNVGRSAATRKRVGGQLWDREPHERWWIAAGAQHPHCRGSWIPVVEGVPDDPKFEAWLKAVKRNRGPL